MSILVVDDSRTQLYLLTSILAAGGYTGVLTARSAQEAFDHLGLDKKTDEPSLVDLILMDLSMPEIDGLEACRRIKGIERLRDIPIIVVTASTELEDLRDAFSAGAMDYISKPPNEVEMLARVRSALRLKHEIDQRKAREESLLEVNQHLENVLDQLQREQEKSERLLLNILPAPIAVRLKAGEQVIADYFAEATVIFVDVVNFTAYASRVSPQEVIDHLNRLFRRFDGWVREDGLQKIKTSGDAYMAAAGVPIPRQDHIEAIAQLALHIQDDLHEHPEEVLSHVRVGFHTGPLVAGVIGEERFIYDLWGDTVNVASRMQTNCPPGKILVTGDVYQRLQSRYLFEPLGPIQVKGKGMLDGYLLVGRK